MRFLVTSSKNMAMVKSRLLAKSSLSSVVIGILPCDPGDRGGAVGAPALLDNRVGIAATVVQVTSSNWPRPAYSLLVTGMCRIWLDRMVQETPYLVGTVNQLENFSKPNLDIPATLANRMDEFKTRALELLDLMDGTLPTVSRLKNLLETLPLNQLADILSSLVRASYREKLGVLNAVELEERFEKALPLLTRQIAGLRAVRDNQATSQRNKKKQKKNKRGIIKILAGPEAQDSAGGEEEEGEDELQDLENKLRELELPDKAAKTARRELKRLRKMSPQMPEYPMLRHYLEMITQLPWGVFSQENIEIKKARADLDSDHYALDAVKRRILEYLAVRKLNPTLRGPILCFAGPPGVGKTSIGKSIAKTLGREFTRISLGGVSDQSDIRGHRRTYIGSMPGRILQGLKQAGTSNPVILLDEIDKITVGIHGDPSAALLEVLDPEQNSSFLDHYLNIPFDLSQVLFIATANSLSTISRPLMDRMEIIPVPGYSLQDKVPIASRHLFPRQLQEHGLSPDSVVLSEESLKFVISRYTREAGVRSLERQLGTICRSLAVKMADGGDLEDEQRIQGSPVTNMKLDDDMKQDAELAAEKSTMPHQIEEKFIEEVLGKPRFDSELSGRLGVPGVAIGMAWTAVGGETMVVEASRMPALRHEGQLKFTGQLGGVMQESATLAMSWIRCNAKKLGILGAEILADQDIHIHFPAGAVEKDGPSAGVTIVTALVSLLTDRLVRPDLSMTGEITLRGLVLPVGGVRDKVLAANRVGIKAVIIPKNNEKDLDDIPGTIRENVEFIKVSSLEEVLQAAFPGGFPLILSQESFTQLSKL